MTMITKKQALLAAAAIIAVPGVAVAQNQVEAQANKVAAEAQDLQQATNTLSATVANTADDATREDGDHDGDRRNDRDHDDDDGGKWGLLGLLGLAGLLGLKRRDDHVHVDRRDHRTTTGTRTGSDTTDTRL